MGRITFILGGAKSGKSSLALELAKKSQRRVAFIATSQALDKEMKKRIAIHKRQRPRHWKTFEEPVRLPILLRKIGNKFELIIIDCLTLLVSNLLLKGIKEKGIEEAVKELCLILKEIKANAIIVSNEVGMAIVPENKLARQFRDIAGKVNQVVADKSDEVFFMISGLPLKLK
ncbi:MAG: bifunctional adenosylcobinamide kinase/adenosylcobinamide-phosphate guanylyltransferase [Candidatus Omnitrophica bacterium]|nr:bifunctional adenosylcobinamide kinase/adenosylcobinamide-phosphate guanylyltransferase [Candidatus Omnitrophota bacterium]